MAAISERRDERKRAAEADSNVATGPADVQE
jgi:hypothetical protein